MLRTFCISSSRSVLRDSSSNTSRALRGSSKTSPVDALVARAPSATAVLSSKVRTNMRTSLTSLTRRPPSLRGPTAQSTRALSCASPCARRPGTTSTRRSRVPWPSPTSSGLRPRTSASALSRASPRAPYHPPLCRQHRRRHRPRAQRAPSVGAHLR